MLIFIKGTEIFLFYGKDKTRSVRIVIDKKYYVVNLAWYSQNENILKPLSKEFMKKLKRKMVTAFLLTDYGREV
jgi:hypothetical protein